MSIDFLKFYSVKRNLPPIANSKHVVSSISKWNKKKDELHASEPDGTKDHTEQEFFDYTDVKRKICLLCERQFKSTEILSRHVAESVLHKVSASTKCDVAR